MNHFGPCEALINFVETSLCDRALIVAHNKVYSIRIISLNFAAYIVLKFSRVFLYFISFYLQIVIPMTHLVSEHICNEQTKIS